jgi:DNA-directed RNA polymerase subunit RPC12/RpoP
MPVDDARTLAPRPLPLECPRCGSRHRRDLKYHHKLCLQCGTEYEKPDFELVEAD